MRSNVKYARENVKLENGSMGVSITTNALDKGTIVGTYIIPVKNPNPEQILEVAVNDQAGSTVISFTDFRDFTHKGGGYFQGIKPLNFPTSSQKFNLIVKAKDALTEDTEFQFIFVISTESCTEGNCQ